MKPVTSVFLMILSFWIMFISTSAIAAAIGEAQQDSLEDDDEDGEAEFEFGVDDMDVDTSGFAGGSC